MFLNKIMFQKLKWYLQDRKHEAVVFGIMLGAIVTGMLIIGSSQGHENFLAEAGRHRN